MTENKQTESKKTRKNKLLMIAALTTILVLAVGGLSIYMFVHMRHPAKTHQAQQVQDKPSKGPPVFEKLDTFVVNLAGTDGALLQIDMQAELADEEAKKRMVEYAPKIRSALILLLSSKTVAELSTSEGKMQLQVQVKQIINEAMNATAEAPVQNVLFATFIIQQQ